VNNLIRMELDDGVFIWVHAVPVQEGQGLVPAGVGEKGKQKFKEVISSLKPLASQFTDQFRGLDHPPDKAEVEFGFTFEAKGGIVIAEGGTQASFKVKLTWNREAATPQQPAT
jgi:hypothetical protein